MRRFLGSIVAIGAASTTNIRSRCVFDITVHNEAVQPSAFHEGTEFGWHRTDDAFVLEQRQLLETQEAPERRNLSLQVVIFQTNLGEGGERAIIGIQLALEGIYLGRKHLK